MPIFAKTRFLKGMCGAVLLSLAIAIGLGANARAQQLQEGTSQRPQQSTSQQLQQGSPEITIPGAQSGGTTLELPRVPQSQQTFKVPPSQPPPQQELVLPSQQLRTRPGYEQVTVTVTNQQGRYVTGLNKDDLRLYVNGRQTPISFFRQDLNTPVSVGILVDTSGSMQPKLPQARLAISEFLQDLNPRDDVFLFAFAGRPFLLQPFTTNHSLVMQRLALLHAYGRTALFDAVLDGLQMLRRGRYDKKALLVITDGMDNASVHSVDDVVAAARRQGVLIYSIGIGNPNGGSGPGFMIGPFILGGLDSDRVDATTLRTLSVETGAKTFIIHQVGDGAKLRQACTDISKELREQYTLGFVAPDASAGGFRDLRVEIPGRPGVSVRVRKGVEVGRGSGWSGSPSAYGEYGSGSSPP